jgi:hypothetical protein
MDFGSTFDERQEEDQYFTMVKHQSKVNISDQIRSFPDTQLQQLLNLKQSRNHFIFPDRTQKSFAELDREYYSLTQLPQSRFEKLAEKKYQNLYNMYNLPYQTVTTQNSDFMIENGVKVQFYTSDKPMGPINENWVTDDSQEREAVGDRSNRNDTANLRVDGSLIDAAVKRTKIVFKDPELYIPKKTTNP